MLKEIEALNEIAKQLRIANDLKRVEIALFEAMAEHEDMLEEQDIIKLTRAFDMAR